MNRTVYATWGDKGYTWTYNRSVGMRTGRAVGEVCQGEWGTWFHRFPGVQSYQCPEAPVGSFKSWMDMIRG